MCSNARRTRQTLDVMAAAWPALAEADSHFLGSLYTTAALDGQTRAHLSDIVAAEAAPEHSCCLCLGHNKVGAAGLVVWVLGRPRRSTAAACAGCWVGQESQEAISLPAQLCVSAPVQPGCAGCASADAFGNPQCC